MCFPGLLSLLLPFFALQKSREQMRLLAGLLSTRILSIVHSKIAKAIGDNVIVMVIQREGHFVSK